MHRLTLPGLLAALTCSPAPPPPDAIDPEPEPPVLPVAAMLVAPAPAPEPVVVDPYAGWETWAESPYQPECFADGDCTPDRTGRKRKCYKRKGALAGDPGRCKPQPLNRRRQKIQRRNLRLIVDAVCQPPAWYDPERDADGHACWRFEWRTAKRCKRKRWCNPEKLHRALRIPAKRESTWDHETDHRLDRDRIANMGSYKRHYRRGTYEGNPHFYAGLTRNEKGDVIFGKRRPRCRDFPCLPFKYCLPMAPHDLAPSDRQNSADRDCNGVPDRWERGYGWFGENAANFVSAWDPLAPPEVLARRVPATIAALRRSRYAWRKLSGGIDCTDRHGKPWSRDHLRPVKRRGMTKAEYAIMRADLARETKLAPTWWLIHRAVWGGDVCPRQDDETNWYERAYVARAHRIDLDPHEQISLEMLGAPVPRDEQWALAAELESQFEPVFVDEQI
jgi:hypothetical protein